MASIRVRRRADGTTAYCVLFRHDGQQSTLTFEGEKAAEAFKAAVDAYGPARALATHGVAAHPRAAQQRAALTVTGWVRRHLDSLTGIERYTLHKYEEYLRNDITPRFGDVALVDLDKATLTAWVTAMETTGGRRGDGMAPKTVANKLRFLAGALNAAVEAGRIPANPAKGIRLSRGKADADHDMRMLTVAEFGALHTATAAHYRQLVEFMVASGMRWGEVSALQPRHVNLEAGTVNVRQAWKYAPDGGYQLGPPKTKRSRRTVDIPAGILKALDLSGEYVFVTPAGDPVRYPQFLRHVWNPAVAAATLTPRPTPHDLRHTYASWQLAGGTPITVVSRQLGHESIQVTVDTYTDVDRTTSKIAADLMAGALGR